MFYCFFKNKSSPCASFFVICEAFVLVSVINPGQLSICTVNLLGGCILSQSKYFQSIIFLGMLSSIMSCSFSALLFLFVQRNISSVVISARFSATFSDLSFGEMVYLNAAVLLHIHSKIFCQGLPGTSLLWSPCSQCRFHVSFLDSLLRISANDSLLRCFCHPVALGFCANAMNIRQEADDTLFITIFSNSFILLVSGSSLSAQHSHPQSSRSIWIVPENNILQQKDISKLLYKSFTDPNDWLAFLILLSTSK